MKEKFKLSFNRTANFDLLPYITFTNFIGRFVIDVGWLYWYIKVQLRKEKHET